MLKGFYIIDEFWFNKNTEYKSKQEILIGLYCKDGSTKGEFTIKWDSSVGAFKLQAYQDSWKVLSKMPELLELLAKIDESGKSPSIKEFTKMLFDIGFTDLTERTPN